MPVVGGRTEPVHVKQGGQAWLNALKLGAVVATHQAKGLVPPQEPMIKAAHNVRYAAPIGVKAARPEWGDELPGANLFIPHDC